MITTEDRQTSAFSLFLSDNCRSVHAAPHSDHRPHLWWSNGRKERSPVVRYNKHPVFYAKTLSVAKECTTVLVAGGVILPENKTFTWLPTKPTPIQPPHIQFTFPPSQNCHRTTQYRRKPNKNVKCLPFFIAASYRSKTPFWGNSSLLWAVRTVSRDVMFVLWHALRSTGLQRCQIHDVIWNELNTESTTRTGTEQHGMEWHGLSNAESVVIMPAYLPGCADRTPAGWDSSCCAIRAYLKRDIVL